MVEVVAAWQLRRDISNSKRSSRKRTKEEAVGKHQGPQTFIYHSEPPSMFTKCKSGLKAGLEFSIPSLEILEAKDHEIIVATEQWPNLGSCLSCLHETTSLSAKARTDE